MKYTNNTISKHCDCCGDSFKGDETVIAELCSKCKDMNQCRGCRLYCKPEDLFSDYCAECVVENNPLC